MLRRLEWFTTPLGRKTIAFATAFASGSFFCVTYLPQTLLLTKYHDFVIMRKYNEPVSVPPRLQKLWNQALDDLNFHKFYHGLLKPFMVFGFDIWHAGSIKTKHGSIIGIPINFSYENVNSINTNNIMVNREPVYWSNKDAQSLLESFIVSDDAKKYAMVREILMTNNMGVIYQSWANLLIPMSMYMFTSYINDSLRMFEKPRAVRVLMYGVIGVFFCGVWALQNDTLFRKYESDVDEEISKLGINYIKGGIEFYDKVLQRNMALRVLLEDKGESLFTSKGNEYFFIRSKKLPLTYRKNFFEEKLKALDSSNTTDVIISSEVNSL